MHETRKLGHNVRLSPLPMNDESSLPADHRSGFVAICGRPNVGKSTLLNALVGDTIAVTTPHPQTTRERMLGVWTQPHFQVVLVDTPGFHRARSALNKFMVAQARGGARDVDLILLLAECPDLRTTEQAAAWEPGEVALEALEAVAGLGPPVALVLNKIDRLIDRDWLLPVIHAWSTRHAFVRVLPTSAVTREGLDALESFIVERLEVGPRYYSEEDLSDRTMRWHAGELIRAELFEKLREELPYSCAVRIHQFEEQEDRDRITATIYVERDSQKGMVIGKGATTIRQISIGARARISKLTGRRCDLRLDVAVAKNWSKDPEKLEKLGYRDSEGT